MLTKNSVMTGIAFFLTSCATPNASSTQYSASSLSMAARTIEAVVVSKRQVQISGTSSVGGTAGAAVGGITGSSIGSSSRDALAGAVVGAVAGGLIGAAIESNATKQQAYEYIVKSDVTGLMTIIQSESEIEVDDLVFVVLSSKPVLVKNSIANK